MHRRSVVFAIEVTLCSVFAARIALAQVAESPVLLGTFAGESAPQRPRGVNVYGTDLGWTFEHAGELIALFGDTWPTRDSLCEAIQGFPPNDDVQGTLPLRFRGAVPSLEYTTQPGNPRETANSRVLRDGQSLFMGPNRTPLTGFSDGERAIGVFQSNAFLRCTAAADGGTPSCPAPFECNANIGLCDPSPFLVPILCDSVRQVGCFEGQTCLADSLGYCVDPTSSQPDPINQVPLEVELTVPTGGSDWESRFTFPTNKLYNMTARTIRRLGRGYVRADYRPGTETLLLWGRPGFYNGPGYATGLYLLTHDLPLERTDDGQFIFRPRYFTGVDRNNHPRWSARQEDARPLALDGRVGGDPTDEVIPVAQMAISWLDEPIRKWVMLYGGGEFPGDATPHVAQGAIAVRYADHPWGPWSTPQTLLAPGAADQPGTLLGPGGAIYDPACVDTAELACARTDPVRPAHIFNADCAPPEAELDAGHLYAPNIIDSYTRRRGRDALDVYWNVSIWNPYRVLLYRSTFHASSASNPIGPELREQL